MRQAGRYLPEYQELRKQYSFNQLAETPSLAREITLQPLRRFSQIDAAILFADILTPSRALGFDFEFSPGPVLKNAILSPDQIEKLEYIPVKKSVPFVFEALGQVRNELESEPRELRRAMLGFAASPWTLACYLIDQGIYKQHIGTKIFAKEHPEALTQFLSLITQLTIEYLLEKYQSGADAVQIFDTWGSLLSPDEYDTWSGKWIEKIISALKDRNVPVIVYISGGTQLISCVTKMKPDVVSIDWRCSLQEAEALFPDDITIQGNVDPSLLFAPLNQITDTTIQTYGTLKRRSRCIANLGHGMLPATPLEGMKTYLSAVHTSWK